MEDMEKEIKESLKEAMTLLVSWGLESICKTFAEQEVCIQAFRHLTEADIIELIPKIGPRSIFRSQLMEWRRKQDSKNKTSAFENENPTHKNENPIAENKSPIFENKFPTCENKNSKIVSEGFSVKSQIQKDILNTENSYTATVAIKEEILQHSPEELPIENHWDDNMKEEDFFEDNDSRTVSVAVDPSSVYSDTETQLDVRSVLNNFYEGVSAMEYYKDNSSLDMHHRKKVVKAVIAAALEKRLGMSLADFHSMATQLIDIFPKESYDTYYIPRVGNIRARGMLYNKYVNLARELRKKGRLEYRRSWPSRKKENLDNGE